MLKDEFLNKVKVEVENSKNKWLNDILECFKLALQTANADFNVGENKTVKECFDNMKKYAEEHQESGCYAFSKDETEKFIRDYLGVQEIKKIKLEDFI